MNPNTSTLSCEARVTAPWMVALSAGVSPPAVRMPIRFIRLPWLIVTRGLSEEVYAGRGGRTRDQAPMYCRSIVLILSHRVRQVRGQEGGYCFIGRNATTTCMRVCAGSGLFSFNSNSMG